MYAIASMIGQCFSIAATQLYSDPPRYFRGNGFAVGSTVFAACFILGLHYRLELKNRRKRDAVDSDAAREARLLGVEECGNKHPDFLFYT
jgi:hypothetical protein